ncbi:MAG: hypothetical protein ABI723_21445 [Bacteroidia bacterium]
MRKLITLFLLTFTVYANAQQLKKPFSIFITDNYNMQFLENDYRITNDSLIITAVNDKGVTHVDYLRRKLTKAEKKTLKEFLKTYNTDSFTVAEYFSEFKNLKFIDYMHYPRLMNLEFTAPGLHKKVKVTNCYVYRVADLINIINQMIPEEVRIKYRKDDFNQTYP